jgi:hypothetical protein
MRRRKNVQYGVQGHHVYWVRGLLMARERREISCAELARMIGLTKRGLNYIVQGRYTGGPRTLNAFLSLREKGLMIHRSDFEIPPSPKSPQSS